MPPQGLTRGGSPLYQPNPQKWLADRALDEFMRGDYPVAVAGISMDFMGMLQAAVVANFDQASLPLRELVRLLTKGEIRKDDLRRAHRNIAIKARASVLAAYDTRINKRNLPHYRQRARNPRNIRYAGGRLRRALNSPDFYEATYRGINFINVDRLNKEARQWRRLNFGAGVPNRSRQFQVHFGSLVVATLGLDPGPTGGQPRAVKLVPGRFIEPGSGGASGRMQARGAPGTGVFYPLGELRTKTVFNKTQNGGYGDRKGPRMPNLTISRAVMVQIQATNFLDYGVKRLAAEWGPEYSRLYRDYFNRQQLLARRKASAQAAARRLPAPIYFQSGGTTIRRRPIRRTPRAGRQSFWTS